MSFDQIIDKYKLNPKKVFLLDGLGAISSSFLLGVVLVRLENIFGIPSATLYFLAAIPLLFVIYDMYHYSRNNDRAGTFLKGIAVMNLAYCYISGGFAFYHSDSLTLAGWAYIIIEICIVAMIAILELKVAQQMIKS